MPADGNSFQEFFSSRKDKNVKATLAVSFLGALLIMALIQVLSIRSVQNLKSIQKLEAQNTQLVYIIDNLKSHLASIESGVRGYAISEDSSYIKRFVLDSAQALESLDSLYILTNSDPHEQKVLRKIEPFIRNKINLNSYFIGIAKKYGADSASVLISEGTGKVYMDTIVANLGNIKLTASQKLEVAEKNTNHISSLTIVIAFASGVFVVAVIIISYIFLSRDLNRRILLERSLSESEKRLKQSSEIKENFLANMSHEIRTPMNAILGFSQLLENTNINTDQKDYIRAVKQSAQNLLTIINDILDSSKIEAGMLQIEKIPFSIKNLIQSIKILLAQKAAEKKIELRIEIDEDIPDSLKGDPVRLTQILLNLGGNAIKFTNKGYVQIRAQYLGSKGNLAWVNFTVKDTGIGIPPENISSIFERFTQANTSITRTYGGTGLGLSIVKSLVDLQGGEISVESEPGKGSVFTVQMQFEDTGEEALKTTDKTISSVRPAPGKGKKVLVIEDNELNQKLARAVLEDAGFRVSIAENGSFGIEMLQKEPFDLVLMDIQMPEMNGYEATQFIRKQLGLNIPIIAMTAHAMSGEKEKCLEAGMNEYISKPFVPEELWEKIEMLLEEKQVAGEFNFDYLHSIVGDDKALLQNMIDIFISQIPGEIEALEQAIQAKDHPKTIYYSHKMKSSFSMMGLTSLSEKMQEIEKETTVKNYEGLEEKYGIFYTLYMVVFPRFIAYTKTNL